MLFMFLVWFWYCSVDLVWESVWVMCSWVLCDVWFVMLILLFYGLDGDELVLDVVEELFVVCIEEIGFGGWVFFGLFLSELWFEYVSVEVLWMLKKYVYNWDVIVGV